MEFDNAFIFRYSQRRDTPAAELPGQLDEAVKEARNQDLLAVVNEIAKRKNEAMVGQHGGNPVRRPEQDEPRPAHGPDADEQDRHFRRRRAAHRRSSSTCAITRAHGFSSFGDPAVLN